VRGLAGTLVDGSAEPVTVPGVRRLSVKLHEGADRLTVTDVSLPDGIDLRLGDGNDDVLLDRVRNRCGAPSVAGTGTTPCRSSGRPTLNQLSISTSSGRDLVVLDDVWVPGDLHVDTGTAPDDGEHHVDGRQATTSTSGLGNDDDVLVLADVAIHDDTDLDGENGDDVARLLRLHLVSRTTWTSTGSTTTGGGEPREGCRPTAERRAGRRGDRDPSADPSPGPRPRPYIFSPRSSEDTRSHLDTPRSRQ
jgi:hypothetical protein